MAPGGLCRVPSRLAMFGQLTELELKRLVGSLPWAEISEALRKDSVANTSDEDLVIKVRPTVAGFLADAEATEVASNLATTLQFLAGRRGKNSPVCEKSVVISYHITS